MTEQGIRMSESVANIAVALDAIQRELKPIEKTGRNESQNYTYAKFENYVDGIKDILAQQGLMIISTVKEPKRLEPRPTKYGSLQYAVEVAIIVRLFHKSGEWIEIDCYGEGQDTGDKAIYKAITGARKYALACLLGLSTTDDPEDDDEVKESKSPPQKSPPLPIAEATISKAFSLGVDAINAADNMMDLKKVFSKSWVELRKMAGQDHSKLNELKSCYEARKNHFESKK